MRRKYVGRLPRTALWLCIAVGLGGWLCPPPAAADPTIVTTAYGAVQGLDAGTEYIWKGIPFAAPPVGVLRWAPSAPPAFRAGVSPATGFANHCPQSGGGVADTTEDCLYLNVYAPKTPGPHPVMVWIYGGALTSGASELYDPSPLVAQNTVVVTLTYRLGALGFSARPGTFFTFSGRYRGRLER